MRHRPIDHIYIAASAKDARFTRICVASVRAQYPDIPIKLLVGGPLEQGLEEELARYWNVGTADLPRQDWGWGFIKLEPLFAPGGESFLVLDSDTVMTGPVLDARTEAGAPFVVDDEQQSEADTHRLYYDWRKLREIDPAAQPPQFVFNSGQWFGTAGVIPRADFEPWIDWSRMPPRHRHPDRFMPGDQGVLNYVLNQRAARGGLAVARRKVMHWPGHGMGDFTADAIARGSAPPRIIHWAGIKASRLGAMPGGDILAHFERGYYSRIPNGAALRLKRQTTSLATSLHEATIVRAAHWGRRKLAGAR